MILKHCRMHKACASVTACSTNNSITSQIHVPKLATIVLTGSKICLLAFDMTADMLSFAAQLPQSVSASSEFDTISTRNIS